MRSWLRRLWILWRARTGVPFRVTMAVLAFAALVIEGLVRSNTWTSAPPALMLVVLIVIALVGLRDNLVAVYLRTTAKSRDDQRDDVNKSLAAAIQSVSEHIGVPTEQLGMSVFRLRKAPPWIGERYLDRYLRFRFADTPHESGIDWTVGKGAIGRVWETEYWDHTDWQRINTTHGLPALAGQIDDAKWASIPEADRRGLSKTEFTRIHVKYAEVLAVPLVHRGTFLGCVALDRTMDSTPQVATPALKDPAVRTITDEAARSVAGVLSR